MDKELAHKWAEALESGKYHQGFHVLQCGFNKCCLGVLSYIEGMVDECNYLKYPDTVLSNEDQKFFIDLNDTQKLSFPEIATKVREKYLNG